MGGIYRKGLDKLEELKKTVSSEGEQSHLSSVVEQMIDIQKDFIR